MKRLFILLMIWSACVHATEKPSTSFVVLKASFKQRRALMHVQNPVEAKGVFVFIKGKGILWNITEPYAKSLLIIPTGIKNLTPDEDEPSPAAANFGGYERVMGQILEAVLNGTVDVIDTIDGFNCQIISKTAASWAKKLTPKDEIIKKFITAIIIEGGSYITRVEIQKAKGEWDELLFLDHNTCSSSETCAVLNASERKAFEE